MDRRQFMVDTALAAGVLASRNKASMSTEEFAPERIVLKANGFTFDALAAGQKDRQLILMLHGFPQFADSWTSVMRPLAAAGYRVVAVDQRGYSNGARPLPVSDYTSDKLSTDVVSFADALSAPQFHLVGHDWGGAVAWKVAATYPKRLRSLSVLSTPHPDAFAAALRTDPKQQELSGYFTLFRAPDHAAETALLADDARLLRGAYRGKVPAAEVQANVRRFADDGTLTGGLNWYRASALGSSSEIGPITVPTLYIWGDQDQALGEVAALATAKYVSGPYRFERLTGKSHWLLEECPDEVSRLVLAEVKDIEGLPASRS
jgi:pimeloyl-ACP methyl ester carboxylesterase